MEKYVFEKLHELQQNGWWWGYGRNRIVVDLLMRLQKHFFSSKILDVGCSEGAFISFLNSYKLDVCAIDSEEMAVAFCRERGFKDKVRLGSILNIPYEDNLFDIVTALDVIEHVEEDDRAVSELLRVCKHDGLVLIIVPGHPWLWSSNDEAVHHKRRYSKKTILELLGMFNVEVKAFSYFNMFLFPLFVAATMWRQKYPKREHINVIQNVPQFLNWLLCRVMDLESFIISKLKWNLPIGSSMIIAFSRKG